MTRIPVKVVPRARRTEIVGWLSSGELKVRVAAAPADGAANAAVEQLLATALGLKRAQVRIVAGHAATRKLIEISHADRKRLAAVLGEAPGAASGSA